MKNLFHLTIVMLVSLMFIQCSDDESPTEPTQETVTDADGNVYNTIQIGEQIWMLQNLKTTKLNDGTPITEYTFDTHGVNWLNLNIPEMLYQWPDNNDLNNVIDEEIPFDYYGAQYNHLAIESGILAPEGWRIPTEADFKTLEAYLTNDGHAGNEATALKSTSGWIESSGNGTDDYGFNALPNGYINAFGGPTAAELVCTWATSDINSTDNTRRVINLNQETTISYIDNARSIGAGIRCIKE